MIVCLSYISVCLFYTGMHLVGYSPYASRFNADAVYSTLLDYFGFEGVLRQVGSAVRIDVAEVEPVDRIGSRKAQWVEVDSESFGANPNATYYYNNPRLVIKWRGVDVSEQFDVFDPDGLLNYIKQLYPIGEFSAKRDIAIRKKQQAADNTLLYADVLRRISDSVRANVSTALDLAFRNQDAADKQLISDKNMETQLQADLVRALNQFIDGHLHSLIQGRSMGAQYSVYDSLIKIDCTLAQYM